MTTEPRTGALGDLGNDLIEAVNSGSADELASVLGRAMGLPRHMVPRAAGAPRPHVVVYRYVCPYCDPQGRMNPGGSPGRLAGGAKCLDCVGVGLLTAAQLPHPEVFEPGELRELPRPPGVMRRPCVDCAYRPGSPEADTHEDMLGVPIRPGPDVPFFCHHGMVRQGDGYESPAYVGTLPLGALVCAGWWALANGESLPEEAFRDPGGSCRREDAPEGDQG